MEMPATNNYGDPTAFAGGAAAGQKDPGTAPSRVLLQQLYDAGMVDALPEDVQVGGRCHAEFLSAMLCSSI